MITYYYRKGVKNVIYSHVYKVKNNKVISYYIFDHPETSINNKWNNKPDALKTETNYFKEERKEYKRITKAELMLLLL